MKLTVAIPTCNMDGDQYFLKTCLNSLWNQTFQDFEIVVTDNADNDLIENICKYYGGIKYFKNPRKGMAQNTNEAIKRSTGEIIKILYMDDHLTHEMALEAIVASFKGHWLINGVSDNHIPYYTDDIWTGNNKLGSPSALTILNSNPLLFDENMTWLLDCDYYKRMYELYGEPVILDGDHVTMGIHEAQATHTMGDERKLQEFEYMKNKYA